MVWLDSPMKLKVLSAFSVWLLWSCRRDQTVEGVLCKEVSRSVMQVGRADHCTPFYA